MTELCFSLQILHFVQDDKKEKKEDDKKKEKTLWNSVYSVVRLNYFFTPMRSFEANHLRTGSSYSLRAANANNTFVA